ncbi:hypothetical protein ACFQ3W_14970 [Paenibacillus puldeungensis]|uniref:Uncharacterized protein n=1 Tax=Paenibacillus puldeungensis TaxID=696536 RepID=A0ABW3RYT1_9BACL
MNLIELYIEEVVRRLPERSRDDIALELRSTIEDMLPDGYGEEEVKQALTKLGDPAVLASEYKDQPMYLIGPRYYAYYIQLLKIILPIVAAVTLISLIADQLLSYSGNPVNVTNLTALVEKAVWGMVEAGVQSVFWITLVVVILERSGSGGLASAKGSRKEWTPDDLKNVRYIPKEKVIPKKEVFYGLLWTAIFGCVYFNADRLLGIYENGGAGLKLTAPVFNQDVLLSYWPSIVLILALGVALGVYKWIVGKWNFPIAVLNAATHGVTLVLLAEMISHPQLFSPVFLRKMEDIFGLTSLSDGSLSSYSFFWVVVIAFLIGAVVDAYQGFRKAGIRKQSAK